MADAEKGRTGSSTGAMRRLSALAHRNNSVADDTLLGELGYTAELKRNRSMLTILFQSMAIAAIPYSEGGPLIDSIYGGGQLSMFLGWIVVTILTECVYLSLAEIASRYPTSAGPYYWAHQLASSNKNFISFATGWIWVIGNWTITLSVNFGFASLLYGTVFIDYPDLEEQPWHLLLIYFAILLNAFLVCTYCNRFLPLVDTICAGFTILTIIITLVALSVVAATGRHSPAYSLGNYDTSLSGWGGFTFFIGVLPAAYTYVGMAMITSMAEEVDDPAVKLPQALSLSSLVGGVFGLFWLIPICVVLPPLEEVAGAPVGQVLPYIFERAMGSRAGGVGLMALVLVISWFCSIGITTAASRTTWAFARDQAIPLSRLWARVDTRLGVPVWSLVLVTVIQALLGLISLGSSAAFNAFVSAGVIGLSLTYAIPLSISLFSGRTEVAKARWNCGHLIGSVVNVIALAWIAFELFLFSLPITLPTTPAAMNYASVIVVGFFVFSVIWYFVHARKVYKGPPEMAADVIAEQQLQQNNSDEVNGQQEKEKSG